MEIMHTPHVETDAAVLMMESVPVLGSLEKQIKQVLQYIGIPAHMKGYKYLKSAVLTVLADMESIHLLTKIVYPAVAKEYGATSSRVERAIRYAIEASWERGGMDTLNTLHGFPVWKTSERPPNSEFIAIIVEYVLARSMEPQA